MVDCGCAFLRREPLQFVERGSAHGSLLLIHKMGVDVALSLVSFVDDAHVTRNFALDASVGLALHPTLIFSFFRALLDIIDGATNDFSLLILG